MMMAYEDVLVGVLYYRYWHPSSANGPLPTPRQLTAADASALEHLATQVTADTGISWPVALRGVIYVALTRNLFEHGILQKLADSAP